MPLVARLLEARGQLQNPDRWFIRALGVGETSSGVLVDEDTALSSTAIFQGVRLISENVGAFPLHLNRRLQPRGRERVRDHPVARLLRRPNPEITAMELREMVQANAILSGTGYAQIVRNSDGFPVELWPIPNHRIRPFRMASGTLAYRVRPPREEVDRVLMGSEVFVLRGFSRGGLIGENMVEKMRESIGLTLAAEKFTGRFFGSGSQPSGVLTHPHHLSDTAQQNLRESFEGRYTGLENSHRLMILEEGMTWEQTGIPPDAAQLLESRQFQVTEASRMLNITPHMLHSLDRATFNNIEELGISFVVYTLAPWVNRWEPRLDMHLLSDEDQRTLFTRHSIEGLLRGNVESRSAFYREMVGIGVFSQNDVRELEDMNDVKGGDRRWVPLNWAPLDQFDEFVAGGGDEEEMGVRERPRCRVRFARQRRNAEARRRLTLAFQRVFEDAAGRMTRAEVNDVRKAVRQFLARSDLAGFLLWMEEWYRDTFPRLVHTHMAGPFAALAESIAREARAEIDAEAAPLDRFLTSYLEKFTARRAGKGTGQMRATLTEIDADLELAAEQRLDEWERDNPGTISRKETHQLGSAIATVIFTSNGFRLVWLSFGDTCPYCNALDGRIVSEGEFFLESGADFQPEGAETPLRPATNIGHPPAHGGCDCGVGPA